ncbi:Dynein light chain type 1, partial [Rhizoctonia solani]
MTDRAQDASTTADKDSVPKAVIKNVDMSEDMQQESIDIATASLEKFNIEKDIAAHIKREFDRRYGTTWHVVVGKNFGSYVTHGQAILLLPLGVAHLKNYIETKHFIYFYIGSLAFLIWKIVSCGVCMVSFFPALRDSASVDLDRLRTVAFFQVLIVFLMSGAIHRFRSYLA